LSQDVFDITYHLYSGFSYITLDTRHYPRGSSVAACLVLYDSKPLPGAPAKHRTSDRLSTAAAIDPIGGW